MNPHVRTILILACVYQNMVDGYGAGHSHKSKIAWKQFRLRDGIAVIPLVPASSFDAYAHCRFKHPVREPAAIQAVRKDRAGCAGAGSRDHFGGVPFIVPPGIGFSAPEIWDLANERQCG